MFTVLSSPFEGDFATFSGALSARIFRRTLAAVDKMADGRGSKRPEIPADEPTLRNLGTACLRPELGAVTLGLRAEACDRDWQRVHGQTLLLAYANELVPTVNFEVEGPKPLMFAGHAIAGDRVVVRGDRERIEFRAPGGDRILGLTAVRGDGIAPVWVADGSDDLIRVGSASFAVVSRGEWLVHWQQEDRSSGVTLPIPAPVLSADVSASKRRLEAATGIAEQISDELYLWISLVLREYVPLHAGKTVSMTFLGWPGHVHLKEVSLLETLLNLVHESCHTYYNLIACFKPFVKPGTPEDYSAIKERSRPVERILLGYHALGNVMLTLALLRGASTGIDEGEIEAQLRYYGPIVAGLDGVLRKNFEHLEEVARAFYLPLRARIERTAVLAPYFLLPPIPPPRPGYEQYLR